MLVAVQQVLAPSPLSAASLNLECLSSRQIFVFHRLLESLRVFFYQDGHGLSSQELETEEFVETMEFLALADTMPTSGLVGDLFASLLGKARLNKTPFPRLTSSIRSLP